MIDNNNNNLLHLFVQVPDTVNNFDGATTSTNSAKLYFDEKNLQIWARGKSYGITPSQASALSTLISEDTNKSVRTIAGEVLTEAMNLADDANTTINNLTEVLNWFKNLPEDEAGALALVEAVGKPAELYTAEDEAQNAEHKAGTVKTAATGLYKLIEDSVAGKNVDADGASGELLVDATASNNKVEVSSTSKLQSAVAAAETSIQSISVAGTALTVSGAANAKSVEITKESLQGALFTDSYTSTPLSYSYLGVSVSIKETDGEVHDLVIDPSGLANRVLELENFNPWETYSES